MHAGIWAVLAAALLLVAAAALGWRLRQRRLRARLASAARAPLLPVKAGGEALEPSAGEARPAGEPVLPPATAEASRPPLAAEQPAPSGAEPSPKPRAPAEPKLALPSGSGDGGAPLVLVGKLVKRAPTRYPLVLAHGFAGFDSLALRGKRVDYFRGVSERLRASGVDVHVLRVSPLASIVARAQQLAEQIEGLGCERVNIVAHSMGGLDARYAIACLGMAPRIASLTTIGTPHRGTPLADLAALVGAFGKLSGRLGAIHDLSPRRMAAFNLAVDDVPGVAYGCVVTAARGGISHVNALLRPGYLFLRRQAGDNDGVVPASSQRWGAVWGEIDVDHWGAVGWSNAFDAAAFYERLAWDLGQRGF
jgi:triacylglycerol lipase